jgi:hypothetical protein
MRKITDTCSLKSKAHKKYKLKFITPVGKVNMELQLDATITRTRSAKQHARKPLHTTSQDLVPYVVKNLSLALLKMGKSLPETC